MTNREWVDLFVKEFNVSRTVAKNMLHACMNIKSLDTEIRKERLEKTAKVTGDPSLIRGNY